MTEWLPLPRAARPIEPGLALLALAGLLGASAPAAETQAPLTTARQIHQLTPDEAAQARPVRIRGVVTSYDIVVNQLFVQDATEGIYIEIGASTLIADDIVDLPLFARKLKQASGPVSLSEHLRGQLTAATKDRLAAYTGGPDRDLQLALVTDLNQRILSGSSLYEPRRFEGVPLSAPTVALLAEASKAEPAPGRKNTRAAVTSRTNSSATAFCVSSW